MEPLFTPLDATILERIIQSRRSIKPAEFSDEQVPRGQLERLLQAANWAPTHGMTEPWRFIVFGGEQRQELANQLQLIYRRQTTDAEFKQTKADKLQQNCLRSSWIIAIVLKRQVTEKIPEFEEVAAVSCAVQNLHLLATALGIAGYWSSGTTICSDELREYLGFSPKDKVLGLFYLGYSDGPWPSGLRQPVADKITWRV